MKKTINHTFQKKLLISPDPKCNKKEFWQLYDRMIGNKNDIIDFLSISDTQKKYALSKKIITRLIYESNFPPCVPLLDFLYNFENNVRNKRSIVHPSRDHYIHMCYLYFLGLYLFFYYPRFNRQLHDVLNLVRTSSGINEEIGFVKNFISVWKYFVLYHDIAYPFEYLGNGKNHYIKIEEEGIEKVKIIFAPKEMQKSIMEYISIKILSVFVAIYNTINVNSQRSKVTFEYLERFEKKYVEKSGEKEFKDFLSELNINHLRYLEYVKTGDDIKYYLTVFPCNKFIVLLKENSNIKYIITEDYFFADRDVQDEQLIYGICHNKSILFGDELHLWIPQQYDIEYYGVNLEEDIIPENLFDWKLLERIEIDVSQFSSMKDIAFESYLKCEEYINKSTPEQQVNLKQLEEICKETLIKSWNKSYDESVKSDDKEVEEHKYAQNFVDEYYKVIAKCKKEWQLGQIEKDIFLEDVVVKYNESYGKIKDSIGVYESILGKVNSAVGDVCKNADKEVFELYKSENYDNLLALLDHRIKEYVASSLCTAVQTTKNEKITTILKDYDVGYSDYDHGITASAVYILHYNLYQEIIQKSKESKWLRIGFGMNDLQDAAQLCRKIDEKYISDYIGMVGQVTYAILVHNLYPSKFRDHKGKIKTSANQNPFAYFCMLCDALQNWGRPFNVNPVEESYPLFLDSLQINIKLDDYINIRFEENNPRIIEKWLKPFTGELNQYLEGAAKLIKIKFV